jgi:hypothetical protein
MSKPLVFLGINLSTFDWKFWLYVIVCIIFIIGASFKLYPLGMPRTVIFAIGAILIAGFYGNRWFYSDKSNTSGVWPPVINMCPDYLTYVETLPGSRRPGCVDMIGVSKNGGIVKVVQSELTSNSALNSNKMFMYTSADVKRATTSQELKPICDACIRAGITWEGVYDGDSCVAINRANQNAAAGGANCLV